MAKRTGALIVLVSLIVILGVPLFARADNATGIPYWATGGLISCTGNYMNASPTGPYGAGSNPPCRSVCDLIQTFVNIIYFAITICLFVLSPIFFAVGGIMMMVSGANPEMLSKGKSVLLSTVIGIAVVLCSYMLVFTFVGIFNAKVNGKSVFSGTLDCAAQFPQ